MWRSPYFSPITSPAGAAANDSSRAPQANQQQFPPGVQQHIQQATPMQCPVARLGGVPAFQPLGSPSALHRTLNPVSQMPLGAPQMIPPGNPFISRSPMQQPTSRGLPSPVAQSSPFNSPLRQVRNSPPSLASPGLTAQQPFRPPTVPPPRGAVSPLQRPNNSSTIPYPGGILSPPQRSLLPSTVPSPGGVIIPPQRLHATATMVPPGGVLTSPQKSFISSTVPPSGGIVMPQQRPLTSLTVPSPGGVLSSPQRPFVSSPGGVPPPPQRPSTSLTVPSPRGIISSPQRPSRPPTLLPSGSFPIPPQQPFVSPTVPSPRRVLSPQQQPFVPASLPSPRGIASPSPPSSPFNRPPHGGFLSPPQQPLVPSALPSPRGLTSQVQVTSSFNSPSWQGQNPYPSYPNMNLQPTVVPSVCPMQHVSPFNSPQQPLRSPQPSAFGLNQGPSIAAALDRRIMEKRLRSAAAGGLPTSMSRQGTNVRPPPVPSSPIGQPAQWRTSSPSKPHASIAFYKDGGRGRENRSRRNYSPGSFGSKPRVSRCFSPPPPDIARVVNCVMSEEYYVKKDDNQVDSCDIKGTEKLTELHNRFEKEILNMASLEQGDNDDEGICSDRSHHTDQDNSDVESLVESDVNDNSVKSRLRLFPSDDEENSDEDSSEVESHALSDSTSGSDNDDEDSNAGGGLSDDDDDDDDDDEHVHKGPSVAEIRKRKIEDPRRLHPELWFNEAGETNDGPVCRCSSSDKGKGIRHGIYPGETAIAACDSLTNNPEKLRHYWVTVTPHTNFMTSNPSIIHADGKDYTFEGFSMFCHHPLDQVPLCSVIRFNIEYTIHVVSQPVPENFCVKDLDLFSEFLFYKVLELEDWNFNGNIQDSCQRYHFMPRFVHRLTDSDGSKACHELLPMSQVLSHVLNSAEPLVTLSQFDLSKEKWEAYSKSCMNAIVMNPDKKPAALRVDDLQFYKDTEDKSKGKVYPYIVHHSIRPVQMSFAGDPKYQRLMKTHNKMRNLISNTPVPTRKNQDKLVKLKIELEKMRVTSSMRRDVVVEVSSRGMIKTGLKSDICQHALLLPVLVHHVRYHMCLRTLDEKMGYVFKDRALLQLALTHPSYHLNFGMNPDHARNSLSNCGVKQPRYGDRKVRHLHTRKKGITQLIRVMSNLGKMEEHQSMIRHNERLEFLGDAVLELISSAHLYFMLPYKPEGGLAMYRSALVQNRHLAQLAKKLGLSDYMQHSHGPDLCLEEDLNHAMANCFEALLGALYLEDGLKTVTELFTKLAFDEEELREVWTNLPKHPLQAQQPDGDRHLIASSELLQKLEEFEKASGIEFTHIRLLARAFTHAQVGFNNLTLGSNQRMEFLGDSVLQFVVSVYLFKHFPEHHEGHLTLLRSSLVNHRIQAKLARELGLDKLINFGSQTGMKAFREKLLADILEAFVAALYVDKGLRHVEVFCRVCLFPRLEEFIINQDWMDAKSQLQQCCLTSRVQGKTPDLPQYKVLQNKGPAHHKHYTVAVYYKNRRLGSGEGKSIQQAEMAAAKDALASHYFPELARQKRLLDRKHQGRRRNYWNKVPRREKEKEDQEDEEFKPQWEEMETFEAEENNHSRAFWEEDDNCQERENWEMEEGSSDARENWEVEVEDWEKEYGDSEERENWGVKSSGVEEKREEEEDEKIDSKENWEDEDENGEERENWEVELSDARENWKEGTNNEAREKWNVENNNAKEIWDEENSDTKEIQEEEKKSKNTGENENLEDENIESKENWEDEKNEPKEN